MLQTGLNSEFSQTMDLFKEIDDLNDLFFLEKNSKVEPSVEHEDLQSKYGTLHENYARETENSKKVEKCLMKCLKFYSKLCKKYEVQQKLIRNLEETLKDKVRSLEEAQKNEERMKGLIEVYRTERTLYAGQTSTQLRKDKEVLLDICCKLIGDSVKSSTTRNLTQLVLRKFKKDLDDDKVSMLKGKCIKLKEEWDFSEFDVLKPDLKDFKSEIEPKSEAKFNTVVNKVEINELEEDIKNNPLDLSFSKTIIEKSDCLDGEHLNQVRDKEIFVETEQTAPGVASSLPLVEELPVAFKLNEKQCPTDIFVISSADDKDKCDLVVEKKNHEKFKIIPPHSESITESSLPILPILSEKESTVLMVNKNLEPLTQCVGKSGSIFDVSDSFLTVGKSKGEIKEKRSIAVECEGFSGISFETAVQSKDPKKDKTKLDNNININNSEKEPIFFYEEGLLKVFREMCSFRLLSPIRDCSNLPCTVNLEADKNEKFEKPKLEPKRILIEDGNSNKNKKLRTEDEKANCSLLDSIMSAMSIQNEEFRAKGISTKEVENNAENSCESASPSKRTITRSGSSKENFSVRQSISKKEVNQKTMEKAVVEEIKNFVLSPITSKEEADKNVKHCISVLSNKSEDVIAKCVVTIVLENIDEAVEIFERPSPPLTKTQHRLMVLLSVFRTLDPNFQNVSNKILSIIWEKLLPDNFFWPDDCVEAASRFYAALCRAKNDPKALWKFCIQGMTDMKQRCPLLMLTALKTWPDILHDASTLKNNMLAVTVVNIFLHMPKKEGLRNSNQGRKLIALKHLLLNFYQFKVEDTIEGYAKKVLESVFREEPASEKSIVLLSICRDQSWTVKNVLPILKSKLIDWAEGIVLDSVASRILSVIKQIAPALQEDSVRAKIRDIGCCLSEILTSSKKNHESEVGIIEVLLQLKQYPEVRKVIREWIPKNPIDDGLRNEIINASAENILRELKLNRRKELKHLAMKKKFKKQSKKLKKKKMKGKKLKKSEKKSKGASVGMSS